MATYGRLPENGRLRPCPGLTGDAPGPVVGATHAWTPSRSELDAAADRADRVRRYQVRTRVGRIRMTTG
jgi:hypothetical protein